VPIIELAKALKAHSVVELWADDPAAEGDLRTFTAATGHTLDASDKGVVLRAVVRRR
jgi:TusA-related sulfurtransferase